MKCEAAAFRISTRAEINARYNNYADFEDEVLDILKRAYGLGWVNYSNMLIPTID